MQQQGDSEPIDIKPVMTAVVDLDGVRYRPPLAPCTTDLATVPAITLEPSLEVVDVAAVTAAWLDHVRGLDCSVYPYDFPEGGPTPSADVRRLAGSERIGTALAISREGWDGQAASGAVVARAEEFADALSGGRSPVWSGVRSS